MQLLRVFPKDPCLPPFWPGVWFGVGTALCTARCSTASLDSSHKRPRPLPIISNLSWGLKLHRFESHQHTMWDWRVQIYTAVPTGCSPLIHTAKWNDQRHPLDVKYAPLETREVSTQGGSTRVHLASEIWDREQKTEWKRWCRTNPNGGLFLTDHAGCLQRNHFVRVEQTNRKSQVPVHIEGPLWWARERWATPHPESLF